MHARGCAGGWARVCARLCGWGGGVCEGQGGSGSGGGGGAAVCVWGWGYMVIFVELGPTRLFYFIQPHALDAPKLVPH